MSNFTIQSLNNLLLLSPEETRNLKATKAKDTGDLVDRAWTVTAKVGLNRVKIHVGYLDEETLERALEELSQDADPSVAQAAENDLRDAPVLALGAVQCSCPAHLGHQEEVDDDTGLALAPTCTHVNSVMAAFAQGLAQANRLTGNPIDAWINPAESTILRMEDADTAIQYDEEETEVTYNLPSTAIRKPVNDFQTSVFRAIDNALAEKAEQILEIIDNGTNVPFLVGPTGFGKSAIVHTVYAMLKARAKENGEQVRYVQETGTPGTSDLVIKGFQSNNMSIEGLYQRVFREMYGLTVDEALAMSPEEQAKLKPVAKVVLFIDEMTRAHTSAQDAALELDNAVPGHVYADRFPWVQPDEPVVATYSPFLGMHIVVPASHLIRVKAANPWGNPLDAALVRRAHIVPVNELPDSVLNLLSSDVAAQIKLINEQVALGQCPLPISLDVVAGMTSPDDMSWMPQFMSRLEVLSQAAATAMKHLLQGAN